MLTKYSDHIKVEGHRGFWYVVDDKYSIEHGYIYLLEHETYGGDAAHLIVDPYGDVIMDDVWNGFDDLDNL